MKPKEEEIKMSNSLTATERKEVRQHIRKMVREDGITLKDVDWNLWGSGFWNPGKGDSNTLFATCYATLKLGDATKQKLVSISSARLNSNGRPEISRISIR